jgi:hypothetical protein
MYPTYIEGNSSKGMDDFVVHPAFETDLSNGGWEEDLAGMWVSKFEMSGSVTALKSSAGVQSLRGVTINDMFIETQNYDTKATAITGTTANLESHLMKNSEWGAATYLAHSSYGRNGMEITRNSDSKYYTGGSMTVSTVYITNAIQSTTGNPYGIYDINGGAWERIASFVANGNNSLGGVSSTASTNSSTKYVTVYSKGTSDTQENNYKSNYYSSANKKFGDAIYETSSSYTGSTSWEADSSEFSSGSNNYFLRSGAQFNTTVAGAFAFHYEEGRASDGWRLSCGVIATLVLEI